MNAYLQERMDDILTKLSSIQDGQHGAAQPQNPFQAMLQDRFEAALSKLHVGGEQGQDGQHNDTTTGSGGEHGLPTGPGPQMPEHGLIAPNPNAPEHGGHGPHFHTGPGPQMPEHGGHAPHFHTGPGPQMPEHGGQAPHLHTGPGPQLPEHGGHGPYLHTGPGPQMPEHGLIAPNPNMPEHGLIAPNPQASGGDHDLTGTLGGDQAANAHLDGGWIT